MAKKETRGRKKKGIVYIFTNPRMEGLVKIGHANDLDERLKSAYTTSVPVPFDCPYAVRVDDCIGVEKLMHKAFADRRLSGKQREYFEIDAEQAESALKLTGGEEVVPSARKKVKQSKPPKKDTKRSTLLFSMIGLEEGDEISFRGDPRIKAEVAHDDKSIIFKRQKMSFRKATQIVLKEKGRYYKNVQGQGRWEYKGELLTSRRLRMEKEGQEQE